jgi:DNA-binding XRE family transcriptional regulator
MSVARLITRFKKNLTLRRRFSTMPGMAPKRLFDEADLASLARKYRTAAGKNRAEAARELGVARQSIIYAEDRPEKSFTKLRCRMIEAYSPFKVRGPVFALESKG